MQKQLLKTGKLIGRSSEFLVLAEEVFVKIAKNTNWIVEEAQGIEVLSKENEANACKNLRQKIRPFNRNASDDVR